MYYHFSVPEKDEDYLRFLWWPDGNLNKAVSENHMTVHPSGARSSLSCSNFTLHRSASGYGSYYLPEAKTQYRYFYVDDCLDIEEDLLKTDHGVISLCSWGGSDLTKFISNSRKLLESLPINHRRKNVKDLDLCRDSLPMKKAFGICWNIDILTISVKGND